MGFFKVEVNNKPNLNFIQVPNEAIFDLDDNTFKVLNYLILVSGYQQPYTKMERITEKLNKTDYEINTAFETLKEKGVLKRQSVNVYSLDLLPFKKLMIHNSTMGIGAFLRNNSTKNE